MRTCIILLAHVFLLLTGCKEDRRYLAVSKIKGAAKLVTTETTIDKVILANQQRKFLGVVRLGNAQFAARTKAFVKAGIDLQELRKEDVTITGDIIEIELPPVKVLDFRYPFEYYEIDYEITRDGFMNKITLEDHERLYRMAELDIRQKLNLTGLQQSTEARTRLLMENLLKGLGFKEVHITFKKGTFIEAPTLTEEDILNAG